MLMFFDICFWFAGFYYLWGGIFINGVHQFTYIQDVFRICAGLIVLGAVLNLPFSRLSIVKGFIDVSRSLTEGRLPKTLSGRLQALSFIYLGILFLVTPLLRHWSFGSHIYDLGAINQIIWNGAFGKGFYSTLVIYDRPLPPIDFFKQHLEIYLYPMSWLYRLYPKAESLLLLQSLCLLGCLIPLWKIACRLFPKSVPPLLLLLFFWLCETVHRVNMWDMHENAFISFFALMAYLKFLEKNWWQAALFTVAVGLFKEDAWVLAGAMGLYFFLSHKRWLVGFASAFSGMAIFLGFSATTTEGVPMSLRYSYLGSSVSDAKQTVLQKPWVFLIQIFQFQNLIFLCQLILIGGGLWLFSGLALIPLAPPFFEIVLSTYSAMQKMENHYVIPMLGPLLYASALGLKSLSLKPGFNRWILPLAIALSLSGLKFSEPARAKEILNGEAWATRRCLKDLMAQIPEHAPLLVEDSLASHVSGRPYVFRYGAPNSPDLPELWQLVPESVELGSNSAVISAGCGYKVLSPKTK